MENEILDKLEKNENGDYIMPLSKTIKTKTGDEISQLVLQEPRAKHMRSLPVEMKMDDILKMVGKISCQPDSVIDELTMTDCNKLADFIGAFQ